MKHDVTLNIPMRNRHSYILKAGVLVLCGGGLFICYAIHSTSKTLDKLMPKDVMTYRKNKPEYIYLSDMKFHPLVTAEGGIHDDPLIINAVYSWWTSFKKSLAWRHLHMAHDEDPAIRLRAIKSLAKAQDLTDSDYRTLAQCMDARTAVGLARMAHSDLRFFLPPPKWKPLDIKDLKTHLMEFLIKLEKVTPHACLSSFLAKTKRKEQTESSELFPIFIEFDEETVLKSLDVMLHHCRAASYGEEMMNLGVLPLLTEIYRIYERNPEVLIKLLMLISYLSLDCSHRLKEFFASGWIGILTRWSRCRECFVSLPCVKALANLDPDEKYKYGRTLYLFHPGYRTNVCDADVIFIHGLLGAVFWTWRSFKKSDPTEDDSPVRCVRENRSSKSSLSLSGTDNGTNCEVDEEESTCWARDWLPKNCPNTRVLGINYRSVLLRWLTQCPEPREGETIAERGLNLMQSLVQAGVGERPVVWVAHSMGGLIVKNMLVQAYETGKPEFEKLYRNTKGIVFLSVPHMGSDLADFGPAEFLFMPPVEIQELKFRSPALISLHLKFLQLTKVSPMHILSITESIPSVVNLMMKPQFVVTPFSADPGVGELFEVPRAHIDMCKPCGRHSFIYRKIVEMVRLCSSENKNS